MIKVQRLADKFAIFFSLLCTFHCLITPLLLIALPSLTALGLQNELYHMAMIAIVIPTSILSLSIGCQIHKKYNLFLYCIIGLSLLITALFLHDTPLGEWGEKIVTILGATIIAACHFQNYKLCKKNDCHCQRNK